MSEKIRDAFHAYVHVCVSVFETSFSAKEAWTLLFA